MCVRSGVLPRRWRLEWLESTRGYCRPRRRCLEGSNSPVWAPKAPSTASMSTWRWSTFASAAWRPKTAALWGVEDVICPFLAGTLSSFKWCRPSNWPQREMTSSELWTWPHSSLDTCHRNIDIEFPEFWWSTVEFRPRFHWRQFCCETSSRDGEMLVLVRLYVHPPYIHQCYYWLVLALRASSPASCKCVSLWKHPEFLLMRVKNLWGFFGASISFWLWKAPTFMIRASWIDQFYWGSLPTSWNFFKNPSIKFWDISLTIHQTSAVTQTPPRRSCDHAAIRLFAQLWSSKARKWQTTLLITGAALSSS